MNRISRNISIIFRSERLMAQRRMAVLRRQTGMMAAAGIAAGLALIMLNVAAYFALVEHISQPVSALIVALANIALAAILVTAANRQSAESDLSAVAEVRDLAMEDLETEIHDATEEIKGLAQSVHKMARDPLGMIAPGLISAVVGAVLKNTKK
ncbi:MAG: hypothetical protein ABJI96_10115 [Paracoccaceae bacterium]